MFEFLHQVRWLEQKNQAKETYMTSSLKLVTDKQLMAVQTRCYDI